jgi:hypothetical protein
LRFWAGLFPPFFCPDFLSISAKSNTQLFQAPVKRTFREIEMARQFLSATRETFRNIQQLFISQL